MFSEVRSVSMSQGINRKKKEIALRDFRLSKSGLWKTGTERRYIVPAYELNLTHIIREAIYWWKRKI